MVDLPTAGLVDDKAAVELRRILKPGGVCVHNYNFSRGGRSLGGLPKFFSEVHSVVLSRYNTIVVSTTAHSTAAAVGATVAPAAMVSAAAVSERTRARTSRRALCDAMQRAGLVRRARARARVDIERRTLPCDAMHRTVSRAPRRSTAAARERSAEVRL